MSAVKSSSSSAPIVSDKYEAILSAALTLFVARGFHGTAVPQVARKAGVAAGTIYHYFKGKDALVNALFRKWKSAIAQKVYTGFPQSGSPREQFHAIWQEMADFARVHPCAFSFLDDESVALDTNLKQFGAGFVQLAQQAGVLKALPAELLMELIFGAFNGMIRTHRSGRVELTPELVDAAEDACWDAIRVI